MAELHRQAGVTLDARGAPATYGPVAAGYRAAHDAAIVVDQGRVGVVDLVGSDVRRWANGMFTQNFRDAAVGDALQSGWCDDRGRLQGLVQAAFLADDHVRMVLEEADPDAFVEHFDRYVLVDDVAFEVPQVAVFSVIGPAAVRKLGAIGLHANAGARIHHADGLTLVPSARANVPAIDIVVPVQRAPALWASMISGGVAAAGQRVAEVLRVEAGRIRFGVDSAPKALPHELALRDRILSFEKGCYVGQETINRLDVMGQARKGLCGVLSETPMTTGDDVYVGDTKVGSVTSPVLSPRFGHIGLAVVRKPYDEGTAVRIGEAAARTCPVPFAVDEIPFPAS